ncbi:hypothetical protein KP806_07520 [Paenibacillus sp. N4]|uniref:hypothetical protein n=1 Tax=Paenibacillus vietnamensis TaxID=2590547 RepID=UPI001CD0B5E5|nr:hypothetical protein [Paenibacillus vietnamensis]MCA0754895.1 hypothetical protein [Paenibacillus vietnamensis]
MDQATIMMLLTAAGIISAILLGWIGLNRMVRQTTRSDAGNDAVLKTDVDYIKRGVDEMRLEMRDQGRRFDALAERVTRVEESAKQAHHRLDRVDKQN